MKFGKRDGDLGEQMLSSYFAGRGGNGRRLHGWRWLFVAACITIILSSPALLLAQEQQPDEGRLLIPPEATTATEVYVDVGISEIFGIDAQEETFMVDARLIMNWVDERHAFDAEAFGYDRKVYQDEAALEKLKSEIWWPAIEIIDARGSRDKMHASLMVYADGDIYYQERFTVLIEQRFNLTDFPFDEHLISFRIEPFSHAADEVIFLPFAEPIDEQWETEEWDIFYNPLIVESGLPEENGDDFGYAAATAELSISRVPNYYLSNFILPLLLIVAISWTAFWMDYEKMNLSDRLGILITAVLTVVAFDFVSSESLPTLSYPTLMDNFLTISYLFLALTVLVNVIVYSYTIKKDNLAAARRIDRTLRWLFPGGYLLMLLLAFIF